MSNARTQTRAFTLLEMLVATAIMVVLAGSLYATLHTAFRARRSAVSTVEEVRQVEFALQRLQADIRAAVVPKGILAGVFVGEQGTSASGHPADSLTLHCTTPEWQPAEGTGDIRMVELVCGHAEDGAGLVLVRRVTTNLLGPTVGEPDEEVLCRGVSTFALRYFDGLDWLDNWDSATQDNRLPAAVEVTLELEPDRPTQDEAVGYRTSRVFLVPCSSVEAGVAVEVPLF